MLLQGNGGLPVQMTCSTLMPFSYGVQERIEATFEQAAVVYTETSWSKEDNTAKLLVYDKEQCVSVALPEANHYYDSLTYSIEQILDGKPGISDAKEAIPALEIALDLTKRI